MTVNNGSTVSHFSWDALVGKVFDLGSDLGTAWISSNSNSQGSTMQIVYQKPEVNTGADTETILIWAAVGVAVVVLVVVLILILKK